MRQTFVCLDRLSAYCASSTSHNLKWLFFRLFPHNSYLRVRSNDLLNEGDILINDDDLAMTETEKNLQFWPRPQNSVFKDEKNNGGEVGDLDGPRAVYQIPQRRQERPLHHGGVLLYYFTFSWSLEEGLKAFIVAGADKKEIAFPELPTVPRFLRFGLVKLDYYSIRHQSIVEKFELFRRHLPSIKATLYDSGITCFQFDNEDTNHSIDCSTLLEHIRNIVSICDSSRGYLFAFGLERDSSWNMNVFNLIASILEMPEIACSSTVYIRPLYGCITLTLSQLPIEIISNWLNRERQAMNQKQRERVLALNFPVQYSQIQEMYDFLKQVSFLSIHILNTYTLSFHLYFMIIFYIILLSVGVLKKD